MSNQENDSKRSNSSSKNNSERGKNSNKNQLNLQNEEELNKVSNRSENGSDSIKNDSNRLSDRNEGENEKMEGNYNETNRTDQTLPENPNFFNKLCSNSSSKKKTTEPIIEVDEDKDEFISALTNYLNLSGLGEYLKEIETKTRSQLIEKYREYIDRFKNSSNYDEAKKIDTKNKLVSKILNYFKELIKDNNKYDKFKNDIMSTYRSVCKKEDDDINFSFNENDNDISQIEINANDGVSKMEFDRNNTNMSETIPTLDFSLLNNEVINKNQQIDKKNKEDENKNRLKK
jgi:hypothetical protein